MVTQTVDSEIAELEHTQLIRRAPEPDPTYLFDHELTKEAAYESLLLKKRHEIHRLVANAYEELYPDRLDENAALLEHHYEQAGDDEKTFLYAVRAGDAAARVFANAEAAAHYAHALDALARLPGNEEQTVRQADTLLKQVGVSLLAEGPVESLKRVDLAEAMARPLAEREGATREDRLRLGRVGYWQGEALIHHNEMRPAIQKLQEALAIARAENDPQLLAMPASVIGRSLGAQGRFAQAAIVLTDAIAALEQIHDEHEWVLATGFRGVALTMMGDYAAGLRDAERALAHADEWNSPTDVAVAHGLLGIVYFFGTPTSPGEEQARAMIETAGRSGDRLYAYLAFGFLAWSEARAARCDDAEKDFGQADAIAQEIGGRLMFADWFAAARAEHALRCGQIARAASLATSVIEQAQQSRGLFAEGLSERVLGEALAKAQPVRLDEAQAHLAASLAKLEEGGARLEAARTHVAWGQVLHSAGNEEGAREHFGKAAAQFRESGLTRELEEIEGMITAAASGK